MSHSSKNHSNVFLLTINRNLIFYNQLEMFHLSKFRSLYAFHWIAIKDDKTLRKILLQRRNLITFAFWFQAHAVHSIYFRQRVISQKNFQYLQFDRNKKKFFNYDLLADKNHMKHEISCDKLISRSNKLSFIICLCRNSC